MHTRRVDTALLKSEDPVNIFFRITHAAKPFFAKMPNKIDEKVHNKYPLTNQLMLTIAWKLVEECYGTKAREIIPMALETGAFSFDLLETFLLHEACRLPIEQMPEILVTSQNKQLGFDESERQLLCKQQDASLNEVLTQAEVHMNQNQAAYLALCKKIISRTNVSYSDRESLLSVFQKYLANLIHPSHLTIAMWLDHGEDKRALAAALGLSHPHDQGKALEEIVHWLLVKERIVQAVEVYQHLPPSFDGGALAAKIVEQWLESEDIESALQFAATLRNELAKERIIQEIAFWLARNQKLEQGLSLINQFLQNEETKNYTLSIFVDIMAGKGKFREATQIAHQIDDREFQQDAFNSIVKKLVGFRKINEAMAFIQTIPEEKQRWEASKIVDSVKAVAVQDKKVQTIHKFFSI